MSHSSAARRAPHALLLLIGMGALVLGCSSNVTADDDSDDGSELNSASIKDLVTNVKTIHALAIEDKTNQVLFGDSELTLGSTSLTGDSVQTLATHQGFQRNWFPSQIASDGHGVVFWHDEGGLHSFVNDGGHTITHDVMPMATSPLAAYQGNAYVIVDNNDGIHQPKTHYSLFKISPDGSSKVELPLGEAANDTPGGIAVTDAGVFFTDAKRGSVYFLRHGDSAPQQVADGLPSGLLSRIAEVAGYGETGFLQNPKDGSIWMFGPSLTAKQLTASKVPSDDLGWLPVAADQDRVYYVNDRSIMSMRYKDGSDQRVIATDQRAVGAIAARDGYVAWTLNANPNNPLAYSGVLRLARP